MRTCSRIRGPRGPIHLPKVPANIFEEIAPLPDGRRRVKLRGISEEDSPIGVEVRCELIHNEIVELKPMDAPVGLIFYQNYEWNPKGVDKP